MTRTEMLKDSIVNIPSFKISKGDLFIKILHLGKKDILLSRFGLNTAFLDCKKDGQMILKLDNHMMEPDKI